MPLEIRQLTVKSVIQRETDDTRGVERGRDDEALREALLEECRRLIARELRSEKER